VEPIKQEIEEQIAHKKELVRVLIARQRRLELQAAEKGSSTPPEVSTEISSLTKQIQTHEAEIALLEARLIAGPQIAELQMRILYVEDMPEHAERYKKVLDAHFGGDNVTHVVTARRALSELHTHPPDVMVADLYIPPGPGYTIPTEAAGLPRIGGNYAYGADICAVALSKGIPIVALSTAPVRHVVREPIEQARRSYGGIVYHLYKRDVPDETQLVAAVRQSYRAPTEVEASAKELQHWIDDRWLDASDVAARMAILNEVQMTLESVSQPALATIKHDPVGQSLSNLFATHTAESDQEQALVNQIKRLLADE